MDISDSADLLAALGRHGLLETAQLEALRSQTQPSLAASGALIEELLRRGWLTRYQADLIRHGRAGELILGSYVLLEPLGEGGMGQVFQARQRKLGRIDAVKVVRAERLSSPDALDRFQREMRAAAALSHPNVVHAYYADEDKGRHYFAMELLAGVDLAHLVETNGPLPFAEACDYIRQAALGLQHAHERGLVHRDVKPQNLMRTPNGVVKVLDLGLARVETRTDSGERTLTETGTVMGTPDYIAPEQVRQSHTVDARADLYSLGCTLYYLLTGRPPFPDRPLTGKVAGHLFEEPEPLEQIRPGTPPRLASLVRRLMAKKPEDRFASAADLAEALQRLGDGSADLAATDAWSQSGMSSPGGKRRIWLVAAATVLLIAGAAGAFWFLRPLLSPRGGPGPSAPTPPPSPSPGQATLLFTADSSTLRVIARRKDRADETHEIQPGAPLALDAGEYALELGPEAPGGLHLLPSEVALAAGAQAMVRVDNYPLSGYALVSRPAPIDGARSWTIVSRQGRGEITHLAHSPDGKWLAETHEDAPVRIFTPGGAFVRAFIVRGPAVRALAWRPLNPDDADPVLAVLNGEDNVRAWSAATGRQICDLHVGVAVNAVAWSADGKTLAAATNGEVRLWDVAAGQETRALPAIQPIRCLAWSPDGKVLAGGGDDGAVHLWRPPDWTEEARTGHAGPVLDLAWSPDSTLLASAGRDGAVRRWPAAQGAESPVPIHTGKKEPTALAWIADRAGPKIAVCGEVGPQDPSVLMWNGQSGQAAPAPGLRGEMMLALSASPDGKTLVCGGGRRITHYWDLEKDKERAAVAASDSDAGGGAAWAPDGKYAATDGWGQAVFVWTLGGELARRSPVIDDRTAAVSWAHGPRRVAYIAGDQVFVWSTSEPAVAGLMRGVGQPKLTAWCPQPGRPDSMLAVAFDDHHIRIYLPKTGGFKATVSCGSRPITALAWAPVGEALAAGDEGGDVYIAEPIGMGTPAAHRKLTHAGAVVSLAWSPDGATLAAAFADGAVVLWDHEKGQSAGELIDSKEAAGPAAWSADGKTLLVLGEDGVGRVWNVETKELLRRVHGLPRRGVLSPDGALAAFVHKSYSLRLWETATGRPLGTVVRLEHGWAVFSETGHYRCENKEAEKELACVVQTDEGQQTLRPEQFAEQYHWKNNPDAARLDTR
ncbi:MAG TPA: protein kinase [Gemmataceae bacterium]|nr:protein kinase [Gemmataceae bacterium]